MLATKSAALCGPVGAKSRAGETGRRPPAEDLSAEFQVTTKGQSRWTVIGCHVGQQLSRDEEAQVEALSPCQLILLYSVVFP